MSTGSRTETHGLVWFEIPADDLERARTFYGNLFGWRIELFPGLTEYWHIETGGSDDTPDGGILKRQNSVHQSITNYIAVASIDESSAKVEELGGKICMAKTPIPHMGYFAICRDPENNTFALREKNDSAQ